MQRARRLGFWVGEVSPSSVLQHRCARRLGHRLQPTCSYAIWTWSSTGWTAEDWRSLRTGYFCGGELGAIDTTLVPLHSDGIAIRRAAAHDGAALEAARRRKERVYPELSGGGRARLVVLAAEVGGRWSSETAGFLSAFGQGTGGVNALPHAEQGPSCLVPTLECHVGVQCSKGVLHVPPRTVACAGDRCSSICARGAA